MNYQNIYNSLISYRKSVVPSGYAERHHIIPKSLGGDNSTENLVYLTAREHFVAHLILAKIHGGKMWAALAYMSRGGTKSAKGHICTSRQYDLISKMDAEWRRQFYLGSNNPFFGKSHGEHALKKMRKPRVNKERMYGNLRPHNGAIISFVHTYKPRSVEVDLTVRNRIDAMFSPSAELKDLCSKYRRSEAAQLAFIDVDRTGQNNPNYGNGQAISGDKNPMWGKEHQQSTKDKIGAKARRVLTCPHCGKIANIANAHRWHFDNCKVKND